MRKPKPATSAAQAAARRLFEAHQRHEPFGPLPAELAPHTAEDAYAIQDCFVALRAEKLGAIAGYKIALSSKEMQNFVGVHEPQAGVMLESTLHRTPAKLRAMDYVHLIIEFEIAVQMAADLPVADAPYSRASLSRMSAAVSATGIEPRVPQKRTRMARSALVEGLRRLRRDRSERLARRAEHRQH